MKKMKMKKWMKMKKKKKKKVIQCIIMPFVLVVKEVLQYDNQADRHDCCKLEVGHTFECKENQLAWNTPQ